MKKSVYTALLTLSALAAPIRAADITVINDAFDGAGSFRQAVADAQPGDRILFSPSLAGSTIPAGVQIAKDLTIRGLGNDLTFRGVMLLPGFTATFDSLKMSGQIYNQGGTLSLINSSFVGDGSDFGAPIIVNNHGQLSVVNCTISGYNSSAASGLILNLGAMELTSCIISGNIGSKGILVGNVPESTLIVRDCTISANSFNDHGVILYNWGDATLINSTISESVSLWGPGYEGGGVYNVGTLAVINSTISNNAGTGLKNRNSGVLTVQNSIISKNSATPLFPSAPEDIDFDTYQPVDIGGGIDNEGTLEVVNSTVYGNVANPAFFNYPPELFPAGFNPYNHYGGIVSRGGTVKIDNSIVWGNVPSQVQASGATVRHSDVQNSGGSQNWLLAGVTDGGGNIDSDPLFDAASRLPSNSPCIDTGLESLLPPDVFDLDGDSNTAEPIPFDHDGNDRVVWAGVDMGAFEYPGYSWSGILQPINADGSSRFKVGSTVPVKFKLTGNSSGVTDAVARLSYAKINNNVVGTLDEAVSTSAATTGNLFRYDAAGGQYIFNWSTKGLTSGTYLLTISLDDGAMHPVVVSLR